MNVSEVICRYLLEAGVDRIYGYPGDPSVEFLESARRCGIDFILGRREGTCALMAEAYGMITGKPGVCLSTLGPGSSNLVNGVANAYLDRVPMIAISGQIAARREPLFTHQVIDHNRIFSPISKWTTGIRHDNAGGVMRRALRMTLAERPGPVHLSTPGDVVGAKATDAEIRLAPSYEIAASQVFSMGGAATDVAARLRASRKPIIVAGISAIRAGATAALVRLAEKTGAAVVVAPMAKGVFPEDHPFFAGTLDMACNLFIWDFLRSSDLVLNIGFDAVELIKPWTVQAPTIHIDSTPNTDQIYFAELEIVGRIPAILDGITDEYGGEPRWSEADLQSHREELQRLTRAGRIEGALNPTDVIDVTRAIMPRETVVTSDVGSHKLLIGQAWTTHEPRGVLMTNGLSSMGFSLPAGIVAKQLRPETPVVTFVGDGGLAMVQSELRLASTLKLGLTVIVFCDGSLNRIELKQMTRQYTSIGTKLEETDIVKLAQSMDCDGTVVSNESELHDALTRQSSDRPLVIGAKINPDQYQAQF